MRTQTLGSLRNRVREAANIVYSDFITNDYADQCIDTAYTWLVDELMKKQVHVFESSSTIATDGTTQAYDLPDDYYRTLAVDFLIPSISPAAYASLREIAFVERNDFPTYNYRNAFGAAEGYRIVGNQVLFYPVPAAGSYVLRYAPAPANTVWPVWQFSHAYALGDQIVNDTALNIYTCVTAGTSGTAGGPTGTGTGIADGTVVWDYVSRRDDIVIDGIAGWEEFIVLKAAIQCLAKENTDASALVADLQALLDRVQQANGHRSKPKRRRGPDEDCGGPWRPWRGGWGIP